MRRFEMADLGLMKYFLGIQVDHPQYGIILSLKKNMLLICWKNKHEWLQKKVETPMAMNKKFSKDDEAQKVDVSFFIEVLMIGSVIYLTNTTPDIIHSVGVLSRFMHNPGKLCILLIKWLYGASRTPNFLAQLSKEKTIVSSGIPIMIGQVQQMKKTLHTKKIPFDLKWLLSLQRCKIQLHYFSYK